MALTNTNSVENAKNFRNADVINAIRNSNLAIKDQVPAADGTIENLIKIGEVIEGSPAFIQHFTSMLTQIASVRVTSREFDEYYTSLIKGDLAHGGLVEEAFVNVTRARDFAPAKANIREFQRVKPDIQTAFHKLNWQAQYTATVDRVDIRKAFTTETGVLDLIDRIVGTLRSSNNLDHKLLTEYLVKRGILNGAMKKIAVDDSDLSALTISQRSAALRFAMPTKAYNAKGVYTHTPRDSQWLVVDADTYARMDVEVLANAFNMDKAHLQGHMIVLDSWSDFDYDRFSTVNEAHEQIENFTAEEVEKLSHVKAVLIDSEAFQIYNLTNQTTDQWSASGLHTNYFLTVERIYSLSPFTNAAAFVGESFAAGVPDTVTAIIDSISESAQSTAVTVRFDVPVGKDADVSFAPLEDVDAGVYTEGGRIIFAKNDSAATTADLTVSVGGTTLDGGSIDLATAAIGDEISFGGE